MFVLRQFMTVFYVVFDPGCKLPCC